jgi:hypothetical protein
VQVINVALNLLSIVAAVPDIEPVFAVIVFARILVFTTLTGSRVLKVV